MNLLGNIFLSTPLGRKTSKGMGQLGVLVLNRVCEGVYGLT